MRGISEDMLLKALQDQECNSSMIKIIKVFLNHCEELQEPRLALEEFLKSGFDGWCWLHLTNNTVIMGYFSDETFYSDDDRSEFFGSATITHVTPIRKPEPPK